MYIFVAIPQNVENKKRLVVLLRLRKPKNVVIPNNVVFD